MTTGILAIIFCAPIAAVLMNTFGVILLTNDNLPVTAKEVTKV